MSLQYQILLYIYIYIYIYQKNNQFHAFIDIASEMFRYDFIIWRNPKKKIEGKENR